MGKLINIKKNWRSDYNKLSNNDENVSVKEL